MHLLEKKNIFSPYDVIFHIYFMLQKLKILKLEKINIELFFLLKSVVYIILF